MLFKTYNEYYHGFDHNGKYQEGYEELITELMAKFHHAADGALTVIPAF